MVRWRKPAHHNRSMKVGRPPSCC